VTFEVKANLNFTLVSILDWKTSPKKLKMKIVLCFILSILPKTTCLEPSTNCLKGAKTQLCEKFSKDDVNDCLQYIEPFYNKVTAILNFI